MALNRNNTDREREQPLLVANRCQRCDKEFFYSYESDICPKCFSDENEARRAKERTLRT